MSGEVLFSTAIQKQNRNQIYQLLCKKGGLSRQDIVYELKLSLPTVTKNLQELLSDNLICTNGMRNNTGGRSAVVYSPVKRAKTAIGIDITMHHFSIVVINVLDEIIYHKCIQSVLERTDEYFQKLGDSVVEAVETLQLEEKQILGVGIAVSGVADESKTKIIYGDNQGITGCTNRDFGRYIPYDVKLFNRSNAAGYAEICKNETLTDAFYLNLSNFVGGALLMGRKIYQGMSCKSGEIGHTLQFQDSDAKMCYCGNRGCVDTLCNTGVLTENSGGDLDQFFRMLRQGDETCQKVWDKYLDDVARTVHNLKMILDIPIIVGGYVGAYMGDYIEDLRGRVEKMSFFGEKSDFVTVGVSKEEPIALGAALHFVKDFVDQV